MKRGIALSLALGTLLLVSCGTTRPGRQAAIEWKIDGESDCAVLYPELLEGKREPWAWKTGDVGGTYTTILDCGAHAELIVRFYHAGQGYLWVQLVEVMELAGEPRVVTRIDFPVGPVIEGWEPPGVVRAGKDELQLVKIAGTECLLLNGAIFRRQSRFRW